MLKIEAYNYSLPQDLIAQAPARKRDHSRLLAVDRSRASFSEHHFYDLPGLLSPGDLLVVNNTRVVPARLFGHKESGGRVEVLVLEHPESENHQAPERLCLIKASRRPKQGSRLFFDSDVSGEVIDLLDNGRVTIRFEGGPGIDALLEEKGCLPLPPYIKRGDDTSLEDLDRERYQTVFARRKGAVAAPTAGLHFTRDLTERLEEKGVLLASVTLHVGYGTFRPVKVKDIRQHRLGYEHYAIPPETADQIAEVRKNGGRIIAVGTTVVRALESTATPDGTVVPGVGKTDLLITPGFVFRVVEGLITNFHLPKSSLLFLVSAFAGFELIQRAYQQAIEKQYRFYSYGDAMLIV